MKKQIYLILCLVCIAFIVSCNALGLETQELSNSVFWDTALKTCDVEFSNPGGELSGLRGPLKNFCTCSKITLSGYDGDSCTAKLYISDANIPQFKVTMSSPDCGVCTDTDFGCSVELILLHSSTSDTITVRNGSQERVFTMQGLVL